MDAALRRKIAELPADPACTSWGSRGQVSTSAWGGAAYLRPGPQLLRPGGGDDRHFIPLARRLLGDLDVASPAPRRKPSSIEKSSSRSTSPASTSASGTTRISSSSGSTATSVPTHRGGPGRQRKEDGARWFGPYPAQLHRETLRWSTAGSARTCHDHVLEPASGPCILYRSTAVGPAFTTSRRRTTPAAWTTRWPSWR